ncbi:hypothetical protein [Vibrio cyclitrophicus]|uniref:hypothetical protein n=1 Tax=Vibrio cyclitrophicus TaxID=47951 RepID=UPI0011B6988A|nr:hypothetical protein [Vibrio cyclitrophicus]
MSVENAQQHWIGYVTQVLGGDLTRLRNNSKNGWCDLRTMLFAFNGHQLYGTVGKAGFVGGCSPFFPVGPSSLASLFYTDLNYDGIFIRHGFNSTFHIRPHQFRHLLTIVGQEQGMVSEILNMWGGRRDPNQLLHYVHEDPKTRSSLIGDIMLTDSPTLEEAKKQVRLVTKQEYENVVGVAASVTSTGICTQQLIYQPCNFFNDFENQCFLCKSSCHVAHDEDAICFLLRDLTTQQQRLETVSKERKFAVSSNMQSWFKIHTLQTALLEQLVALMTSKSIEPGSIIRLLIKEGEVRITNLKTKKVRVEQFSLPDVKQILADKLAQSTSHSDDTNDFLDNLLGGI